MRIYGRLGKTGVRPFDDSYFLSFGALSDMVSFCRASEARGAPDRRQNRKTSPWSPA